MDSLFKNFHSKFNDNKALIKDLSFKTIRQFMGIFANEIVVLNNNNDFNLNFIFDIMFNINDNDEIENIENEYINLIFVYYFFSLNENLSSEKQNEFFTKMLKVLVNRFTVKQMLINFKLFKKTLNFILKHLILSQSQETILQHYKTSFNLDGAQDSKKEVLNFLAYTSLYQILNKKKSIENLIFPSTYINILFSLFQILKYSLTDHPSLNQLIQSITNSFNYIFNKHYFLLSKLQNQSQFTSIKQYFLSKLSLEPLDTYENFIYIISDLVKYQNSNDEYIIPIIKKVLISNNGLLHKVSINMLNEVKDIDKSFISKYISVYDVLDGFNSHLFKSLHNELEYVIKYIDENEKCEKYTNVDKDGYLCEGNKISFKSYMNYFLFLSRKIFNHTNSRIQKFFIKTIANLELTNKIFGAYLSDDFLGMINNPLLYPENDLITYHSKMGLIIEKFITKYLNCNFELLSNFITGISKYISNRKIFVYLMKSLCDVLLNNQNVKIKNDEQIIDSLCKIIDLQMKTFSYYNKNSYWRTICEIFQRINLSSNFFANINKIYNELLFYVINYNKDLLSVDYLYFGENDFINKKLFIDALKKVVDLYKDRYKYSNNKNEFIAQNNFESTPAEIINSIYNSLSVLYNPNNAIEYINSNIDKLFSSYLPPENKTEIIININSMMKLSFVFEVKLQIENETFENVFFNLKNIFNTIQNDNCTQYEYIANHFELYEEILFHYIQIYKKGINDLLINSIEIKTNISNVLIMKYYKMLLFNFLSCVHYEIFTQETILNNQVLKQNIKLIFNNLLTIQNQKESEKILYTQVVTLTVMIMKMLNINYDNIQNISNCDELLSLFDISSSSCLFYVFKFFDFYFELNSNNFSSFEKYSKKGIQTLCEKRENFSYVNVLTFLKTLLSSNKLNSIPHSNIIKSTFTKLIELNDNRIWLLAKISTELLLEEIKLNHSLISKYSDVIMALATVKESRGEDALMLETSPLYMKSPFNLRIKKILPFNEDIAKYGLYVRYGILKFIEKLINQKDFSIYNDLLHAISTILIQIDEMSGKKPEMNFTDKHRKKLRLSQLLLTLGYVFTKDNFKFNDTNKQLFEQIEKSLISILQKINLYSVDFYIFQFCIFFVKHSVSLRKFLLENLTDPKTKAHVVTSSLIISSICVIEQYITDNDEKLKFINAITMQCTSNICNIRGFAQYFISKINTFKSISSNYLSDSFLKYLSINPNIQKFFKKFDEKYNVYISLIKEFSVDKILKNAFDEIYNEIIPIDINNEFKILSAECMVLDNQDYSKANNSWKHVFNSDEEIKEQKDFDFQKKYRPIDIDIYHNKTRKRLDVVIVASLVDKIPNLGGLARTCEVFNIGAMTIASDSVLNDNGFLTAASSAERWMPLVVIPPVNVKEFIISYKKMGYTIVGLEQTQNSVDIKKYEFKEKIVIVLGNEKEGIPQDIIDLIDHCVVIPQYGEIRSLNVHVSAAIMIWEVINKILGGK